jgi:pimeloyl-ACP methyl ester carboxylesterase
MVNRRTAAWWGLALVMLTGCSVSLPGDLAHVARSSTAAHAGHVYFIRGFMGWWSRDLDDLADQVRAAGVDADVYAGWQWADLRDQILDAYAPGLGPEPIVLVGHSYGSDEILKIARAMRDRGQKVDLLITIDPVTPIDAPGNITCTLNYYQTNGFWDYFPWWRGVPLEPEEDLPAGKMPRLCNMNVRTDRADLLEPHTTHKSMPHNRKIQAEVLADVLAVCPARATWQHGWSGATVPLPASQPAAGAAPTKAP